VLHTLEPVGAKVWIDGGWGVDALLGEVTRQHTDLDLAVDREQLSTLEDALQTLGLHHDTEIDPGLPARLVLRDQQGRQVDVHPLVFDDAGNGWQELSPTGKAWGRYPVEHLQATGAIGGRSVRCLSPELQVRFRLAHEWTENDEHDLRLLADHFDVGPLPPPLRRR
jgi:lincosamide nucleotidyltransferase A/C/D/E